MNVIIWRAPGVPVSVALRLLVLLALVVACGPAAVAPDTRSAPVVVGSPAATTAAPTTATPGMPSGTAQPRFMTYAFTNVRDGSRFTLSDFRGKSVLVIGMAVW